MPRKAGLLREDETSFRLKEKGCFLADGVAIQFYRPEYLPFPKASYTDEELNPYLRIGGIRCIVRRLTYAVVAVRNPFG